MNILAIADDESKSLWDFYDPVKLENVDLIITDQRVPESFETFAARRQIRIQYTQD